MWVMSNIGFFSIVQKPGDKHLTVRARVKNDLDNLRQLYLPELSLSVGNAGTDYPWRATVTHEAFAVAFGKMVMDIGHGNFKKEVAKKQGDARAVRYQKVGSALNDLPQEDKLATVKAAGVLSESKTVKPIAYGGVVFDSAGKLLLREPRGHFDDYVWTFPKGRPDKGETPEMAALRETREETGAEPRIIGLIPGEFEGGTTQNRYYLMTAPDGSGGVASNDRETASVRWATPEEARELIMKTTNAKGRKRDLAVLEAGIKAHREILAK